jgi:hypothetical protein
MNREELKKRLIDEKIPRAEYSLDGGLPNEACCLGLNDGKWEIYYSERGRKTGLKVFASEEAACDYFYTWLTDSLKNMGLI